MLSDALKPDDQSTFNSDSVLNLSADGKIVLPVVNNESTVHNLNGVSSTPIVDQVQTMLDGMMTKVHQPAHNEHERRPSTDECGTSAKVRRVDNAHDVSNVIHLPPK